MWVCMYIYICAFFPCITSIRSWTFSTLSAVDSTSPLSTWISLRRSKLLLLDATTCCLSPSSDAAWEPQELSAVRKRHINILFLLKRISATKTETLLYQVKHQFDGNGDSIINPFQIKTTQNRPKSYETTACSRLEEWGHPASLKCCSLSGGQCQILNPKLSIMSIIFHPMMLYPPPSSLRLVDSTGSHSTTSSLRPALWCSSDAGSIYNKNLITLEGPAFFFGCVKRATRYCWWKKSCTTWDV